MPEAFHSSPACPGQESKSCQALHAWPQPSARPLSHAPHPSASATQAPFVILQPVALGPLLLPSPWNILPQVLGPLIRKAFLYHLNETLPGLTTPPPVPSRRLSPSDILYVCWLICLASLSPSLGWSLPFRHEQCLLGSHLWVSRAWNGSCCVLGSQ